MPMHNPCYKIVGGTKVACQRFDGAGTLCCFALYRLGTEISRVEIEAWVIKIKEQTLYWVLNEFLTNVHLRIT